MKQYPPSVQEMLKEIKALDKAFDSLVKRMKSVALVKVHYDLIEGELRETVYAFKDEVDVL